MFYRCSFIQALTEFSNLSEQWNWKVGSMLPSTQLHNQAQDRFGCPWLGWKI